MYVNMQTYLYLLVLQGERNGCAWDWEGDGVYSPEIHMQEMAGCRGMSTGLGDSRVDQIKVLKCEKPAVGHWKEVIASLLWVCFFPHLKPFGL